MTAVSESTTVAHPLEPLTAEEISTVAAVLRASGNIGERARFAAITLREPAKDVIHAFAAGDGFEREADALVVDHATCGTYEAVVSLTRNEVVSWVQVAGGQAMNLLGEMMRAIELTKADPRYVEALAKRGITDLDALQLDPWPAGNFGIDGERDRRLVRVISYVRDNPADNGYAHPIEGVVVTVDAGNDEVLAVEDHGVVPVPEQHGNYDGASVGPLRTDLKPLDIVQPEGPSFTVIGNEVHWQKWRFRVSMHPLDGLVLHTVGYEDQGRVRPILHRAALSEMVVPYGEAAPGHRWKNAFDSGELGLGRFPFVNSLELGCDCLGTIHYFDAAVAGEDGEGQTVPNAICMHEEDYGILWKHFDMHTFTTEVRRSRRLVVSSIHTVGNYEYGFFWYFYLDGTMQLEVKLTGILQTMAVANGDAPPHAALVAPQLAAPHHQHLFNFRLDFDVDGPENSVYETELTGLPAGPDNPYGNATVSTARLLAHESEAQRVIDPARGRQWMIVNPNRHNAVGRPVAYRIVPGNAPTMLADDSSAVAKRAAFARRNLWVTPYAAEERRAAGYPNLHPGGAGLPQWTAADRPLENTDVVVWFTFGVNHVARPEDWPVMPVEYVGFTLQPFGFFDRNPALDVPPSHHHSTNGDAPS
jgi:primary-amine oxidase